MAMAASSSCLFVDRNVQVLHYRNAGLLTVKASSSEGPLRRPTAPVKPIPAAPAPTPPPPQSPPSPSAQMSSSVTIEYQRRKAKELQEYFLDKKYEEQAKKGQVFGWTLKNEIGNGRWAMFGFAVGLLTEYATGSDFVEQLKIIVSNLGIVDLD